MDNQEHSLAFELLMQAKENAKRWFIAFVIMVFLEIATIVGFLIYVSLPVDEYGEVSIDQDTGQGGNNYNVGGDYNGSADNKEGKLH